MEGSCVLSKLEQSVHHPRMNFLAPVPSWNARGIIEPINPIDPTSADRSPFRVSLRQFVQAFGTTGKRVAILQGLMRYRGELHQLGITTGFQWLDGSFLERIEVIERRDPGDIDVVTFFEMPIGQTQLTLKGARPELFPASAVEQAALKDKFHVDGYTVALNSAPARLVARAAYWYSMWSHRRDQAWKGFVEIDLDAAEDSQAIESLKALAEMHALASASDGGMKEALAVSVATSSGGAP